MLLITTIINMHNTKCENYNNNNNINNNNSSSKCLARRSPSRSRRPADALRLSKDERRWTTGILCYTLGPDSRHDAIWQCPVLQRSRLSGLRGWRGITPNLPTKIIPAKICWLKKSGRSPMDLRIPPFQIKSTLESNPPKSRVSVRRLAVQLLWWAVRCFIIRWL